MAEPEWISIADFTPGIVEDFFVAGGGGAGPIDANGAATRENTYACCADPASRALVPLPGVVITIPGSLPGTLLEGYYASDRLAAYTCDAMVLTRVIDTATLNPWVVYAWEMEYDPAFAGGGGGSSAQYKYAALSYYFPVVDGLGGDRLDVMFTRSSSTYNAYAMASLTTDWLRSVDGTSGPPYPASAYRPILIGNLYFFNNWIAAGGAMSAAERALTSFDSLTANNWGPKGGVRAVAWAYPDPTAATTASVKKVPSSGADDAYFMLGHQGRAVFLEIVAMQMGANAADKMWSDVVSYSPTGKLHGGAAVSTIFVEENASGYGTGASLTANELFLVKNAGGAVSIRGDLDYPQVVRLPFVESTKGVTCKGVHTPMGFVYGSRTGVYAYAGGDVSQKLSPQLEGFFWQHELDPEHEVYGLANRGRFGWWDPFLLVPNDWVMDSRTKAWWRLQDTEVPFNCYDVFAPENQLYAFHYKRPISEGASADLAQVFDQESLASSWSWQSQPLLETRDRVMSFREVRITAQKATSAATIVVTLTGRNEAGGLVATRAITFDLGSATSGQPATIIKDVTDGSNGNFVARYVQVKVVATGTSGPAPKLYEVAVGVQGRSRGNRDAA